MKGALFKGSEELQLLLDSFLIALTDGHNLPLVHQGYVSIIPFLQKI